MSVIAAQFLSDVRAVIIEQGLGKVRATILSKQLESRGGVPQKCLSDSTTHVLVGANVRFSRLLGLLKVDSLPVDVLVLRADWLSTCLVKGEPVDPSPYAVVPDEPKQPLNTEGSATDTKVVESSALDALPVQDDHHDPPSSICTKLTVATESSSLNRSGAFPTVSRDWKKSPQKLVRDTHDSDSDYVDSGEESGVEGRDAEDEGIDIPPPSKRKRRWICELSSSEAQSWVNHNKHITDKLQELVTIYQNNGDKWRAMSTTKAIAALRKYPKEITSYEEAYELPFVGERLASKIWEIVSSGSLRRLEHVDHEKEKVISLFKNIHGVGQITAQQFYAQGYRTLDDLENSGILNRQQQIGIKYYDEFLERMARSEVEEIEAKVREVAESIVTGVEVITCGSYRRGKSTCGDVDLLLTHPDGRSHRGLFSTLMEKCKDIGFLTDDLTVHDDPVGSSKYLGVCILGKGRKHRRIDIFVVPYSEFPLALLHFTGSGHFNRSMRSKADKLGMSLSEHSLNTGVIRKNGAKIFDGTPLPVFSEEDVFRYLDIPYRDPKDRDWD